MGEIPLPQSGSVTELGNGSTCECCDEIDRLSDAIAAVLELHKEVQWAESWPTCLHCNDGEGSPLAYPCLTVAAIQSALGEGEK